MSVPHESLKTKRKSKRKVKVFAGYDPGKKKDYAGIVFVRETVDKKLNPVTGRIESRRVLAIEFIHSTIKTEHLKVADLLVKLSEHYNIIRLGIDSTGVGDPIYEYLKPYFGDRIVPIVWSAQKKEQLFQTLRIFLEEERLILPSDATDLITQLRNIEFEYSKRSDRIIFSHPENIHDDLVAALAMAVWVYQQYMSEHRVRKPATPLPKTAPTPSLPLFSLPLSQRIKKLFRRDKK